MVRKPQDGPSKPTMRLLERLPGRVVRIGAVHLFAPAPKNVRNACQLRERSSRVNVICHGTLRAWSSASVQKDIAEKLSKSW